MIGTILSVATSTGQVALDSSLTIETFGPWILHNHAIFHMGIGRFGFNNTSLLRPGHQHRTIRLKAQHAMLSRLSWLDPSLH